MVGEYGGGALFVTDIHTTAAAHMRLVCTVVSFDLYNSQ